MDVCECLHVIVYCMTLTKKIDRFWTTGFVFLVSIDMNFFWISTQNFRE